MNHILNFRPQYVIAAQNGANLTYYAIDRIVRRNYTTNFLLRPLIWSGCSRTGFSCDVVYEGDIQWWSFDEMTTFADEWERVYV